MYQYIYQYMYQYISCINVSMYQYMYQCISCISCTGISCISMYQYVYQYISCINVSRISYINISHESMYQCINILSCINVYSLYNFLLIELSRLAPLRRPRPFPLFPPITFPITFPSITFPIIPSIPFSSFIFTRTITAARPKPTFPPNNKLIKGRLAR